MKLTLTRYYRDSHRAKGILTLDGRPFGETREALPVGVCRRKLGALLPPGTYTCRPTATMLSPMTLKVCQAAGHTRLFIAYDPVRQEMADRILVGQADMLLQPEERELVQQAATFEALTQRVYQAYAAAENITLEVAEEYTP